MMHVKLIVRALIICSLILGLTACGALTRDIEQTDAESARLQVSVKALYIESANLDAAAIGVEVVNERIVLSGFVGSQSEMDEAVSLAESVAETRAVINNLKIR